MNQGIIDYQCIDFKKLLLLKSKQLNMSDAMCHVLLIMMTLEELNYRMITPKQIAKYSSLSLSQIDSIMIKLINSHILDRNQGQINFNPLYKLLLEEKVEEKEDVNLIDFFEDSFGRSLSSTEIEFINDFKRSGFDDEMIIEALKEAVKSGVLNFRYIEKILDNWKKYGKKIRNKPVESEDVSDDVKNYNWWQ